MRALVDEDRNGTEIDRAQHRQQCGVEFFPLSWVFENFERRRGTHQLAAVKHACIRTKKSFLKVSELSGKGLVVVIEAEYYPRKAQVPLIVIRGRF
jgi:hypothetical protein